MKINEVPQTNGVYILFRYGKCVYVGSSITMRSRVASHARYLIIDSVEVTEVPEAGLKDLEQHYRGLM